MYFQQKMALLMLCMTTAIRKHQIRNDLVDQTYPGGYCTEDIIQCNPIRLACFSNNLPEYSIVLERVTDSLRSLGLFFYLTTCIELLKRTICLSNPFVPGGSWLYINKHPVLNITYTEICIHYTNIGHVGIIGSKKLSNNNLPYSLAFQLRNSVNDYNRPAINISGNILNAF